MLCPDVMELVGQKVSQCREVYQNKSKYDAVVRTMKDAFRGGAQRSYIEEFDDYEQYLDNQSPGTNYSSYDDHHNTFISDFKEPYGVLQSPELRGSNLDINIRSLNGKWSNGWGGRSGSAGWTSPATARGVMVRYEIYGIY